MLFVFRGQLPRIQWPYITKEITFYLRLLAIAHSVVAHSGRNPVDLRLWWLTGSAKQLPE